MKRVIRKTQGVTLLETMLVLAIAAMIIVMSVRYYQSASAGQQTASVLQQIQAITAAADGLAQPSGSYSGINAGTIASLLPGGSTVGLKTPWGSTITIGGTSPTGYTVTIPETPPQVCPQLEAKLSGTGIQGNHFTKISPCKGDTKTDFAYTYVASP
ncbi:MAG TPA: hypothetical protein VNC84_06940 [Gammaproteobacteria bacterium]|jgi:type II secretory pathway pseudopilin PulG|nr:hypothetical protein [Gammaproteobacteria bacterium]